MDPDGISGESDMEGTPGYPRERETTYRLCPNYASDINSPLRCVQGVGCAGRLAVDWSFDLVVVCETTYRLCPNCASDINSPLRCVQ